MKSLSSIKRTPSGFPRSTHPINGAPWSQQNTGKTISTPESCFRCSGEPFLPKPIRHIQEDINIWLNELFWPEASDLIEKSLHRYQIRSRRCIFHCSIRLVVTPHTQQRQFITFACFYPLENFRRFDHYANKLWRFQRVPEEIESLSIKTELTSIALHLKGSIDSLLEMGEDFFSQWAQICRSHQLPNQLIRYDLFSQPINR